MPWAMETKTGFGWATVVVVLFLVSVAAMAGGYGSGLMTPAMLLLPIIVYIGFLAWVNRAK